MSKKIGCKKCGSKEYFHHKIIKRGKVKYFIVCKECKKPLRVYPENMAYAIYFHFRESKVSEQTEDLYRVRRGLEEELREKLNKEYNYLRSNLILFFEYIFLNDLMKEIEKVQTCSVLPIVLKYKEPLTEDACISICNELKNIVKELGVGK